MVAPTWQLRIDWDNAGDFSHPSADVTDRVVDAISCYRGRDFNAYVAAQPSPGRLMTKLDNRSGDYSFFNTSSPIHGDLVPGCLVQLRSQYGTPPTWRPRWTGYLSAIRVTSSVNNLPAVEIEADGAMNYINQQSIDLPGQIDQTTGSIIDTILRLAGLEPAMRQVDPGRTTLEYYIPGERVKPTDLLRQMEITEAGFMQEGAGGGIVSHDRHFRVRNRTSVATYSDVSAPGVLLISDVSHDDPLDSIFADFFADAIEYAPHSDDVASHPRIWEHMGAPIGIEPGATTLVAAVFTNITPDIVGIHTWDTPVVRANSSIDGLGRNMSHAVSVAVQSTTRAAFLELTNTNATTPAYVTSITITGVRLRRVSELVAQQRAANLALAIGGREFPARPQFNDPDEARHWAEWQRALFENPQPVLTITVPAFRDDAHLADTLARDISDRVSLGLQGGSKVGVLQDFFIERIQDFIDLDGSLTTTYSLISAGPYSGWVVFGVSTFGDDHRFGW